MKTKKIVIAVLMATLLISAALIVGCMNQLDELSGDDAEDINYQIPAGKGIVRLKIADIDKKLTILPSQDPIDGFPLTDMYFDVKFTNKEDSGDFVWFPKGVAGAQPTTRIGYDDFYDTPIALDTGKTYTFVITAYNVAAGTIPIAGYTSSSAGTGAIGSGTISLGPYNLLPFVNGTKDGTFNYSIKLPANTYNTKTLVITKHDGTSAGVSPITLNEDGTAKTGTESLPSGYYFVTVTVGKTNYLTQIYKEALHIYPAMPSIWEIDTTSKPLVQNIFAVSFNTVKSLTTGSSPPTQNVNYAGFASDPGDSFGTVDNYDFDGWWTATSGGTKWTFTSIAGERIFAPRTLYAQWTALVVPGVGLQITFDYDDLMDSLVGSSNATMLVGTWDGLTPITFTLNAAPTGYTWVDIVWTMSQADLTSFDGTNTATISNTAATFGLALAGDSAKVTVTAKLKANSVLVEPTEGYPVYSADVKINVTH